MVRRVRMVVVILSATFVGVAISACRDIDEPPPVPLVDPNAPQDGGADGGGGGMVRSFVHPYALSIAC